MESLNPDHLACPFRGRGDAQQPGDGGGEVGQVYRVFNVKPGRNASSADDKRDEHILIAVAAMRFPVTAVVAGDDDGGFLGESRKDALDAVVSV